MSQSSALKKTPEGAERAAVKKRINLALGSALVEEKSYADYTRKG